MVKLRCGRWMSLYSCIDIGIDIVLNAMLYYAVCQCLLFKKHLCSLQEQVSAQPWVQQEQA